MFIRPRREDGQLEDVAGQWGLIGWFAKAPVPPKQPGKRPILTNNARFETIHKLATYKDPWARGQRCIIPAWSYVEPNWETGKNQWWRFRRADGQPWGMASMWNTWTDKETGELHESYTMVTLNADHHPLLNRMHLPDPERPATMHDKRAVVPLHPSASDVWLRGTLEEATADWCCPTSMTMTRGPMAPRRHLRRRHYSRTCCEIPSLRSSRFASAFRQAGVLGLGGRYVGLLSPSHSIWRRGYSQSWASALWRLSASSARSCARFSF